jgi:glycoprotein endo-alpha-1,2-mannosidase
VAVSRPERPLLAIRRLPIAIAAGTAVLLTIVILLLLSTPQPAAQPAAPAKPPAQPLPRPVFIHYYAWYTAPPFTSDYGHWDGGNPARPGIPANITSASYPLLDPYSSTDPAVLQQHMIWMKEAKADILIYSWWGRNDPTDTRVKAVMDAAARQGLRVAFQLEPYRGRTVQSVIGDLGYLYREYGGHPAFYRASRGTMYGPSTSARGVFFLYDPPSGGSLEPIRGTANDAIVLGRMDDGKLYSDAAIRASIAPLQLDGLYNYGQYTYRALPQISADYIVVYAASPGFDNTRTPGAGHTAQVSRDGGAYYDRSWQGLVDHKPEATAIVSFNEWHETTQIEPAKPSSYDGFKYLDYQGHYGLDGAEAPLAYLERTAYWVSQYKS